MKTIFESIAVSAVTPNSTLLMMHPTPTQECADRLPVQVQNADCPVFELNAYQHRTWYNIPGASTFDSHFLLL